MYRDFDVTIWDAFFCESVINKKKSIWNWLFGIFLSKIMHVITQDYQVGRAR